MNKKLLSLFVLFALIVALVPAAAGAAPLGQGGSLYTIQLNDWLSKLADKEYGDPLAYPAIVHYSNLKAEEDSSLTVIENPDLIEPGWIIYLPTAEEAQEFMAGNGDMMETEPAMEPTAEPAMEPTAEPTMEPTAEPAMEPTAEPTMEPTAEPEPAEEPEPSANPLAPPPGVARVYLQNFYSSEYNIDFGDGSGSIQVSPGAEDFYHDLPPGKYNPGLSLPGGGATNVEFEIAADEAWLILVTEDLGVRWGKVYP